MASTEAILSAVSTACRRPPVATPSTFTALTATMAATAARGSAVPGNGRKALR